MQLSFRRSRFEDFPDDAVLFVRFSDEDRCVSVENVSSRGLLDVLLFEAGELYDLLCLGSLGEYLLILDLLRVLLLLDARVVVLEEEVLVVEGLHPDLIVVTLVIVELRIELLLDKLLLLLLR